MAIGSVIRSYPAASVAWGVSLLLGGSLIFLYSARSLRITFLPLLGLAALTGLPFTPAASGWEGLVIPPFNIPDILFLIAHATVMAGFLRHTFTPGERLASFENWIQVVYPLGLFILPAAYVLIGIVGWEGSFTVGRWWASLISLALMALIYWLSFVLRRQPIGEEETHPWYVILLSQVGNRLAAFFRLNWIYRILIFCYNLIQQLIQALTVILEGDGGLLWALLLLALFLIALQGGAVQ
jgi:hypothetical protein